MTNPVLTSEDLSARTAASDQGPASKSENLPNSLSNRPLIEIPDFRRIEVQDLISSKGRETTITDSLTSVGTAPAKAVTPSAAATKPAEGAEATTTPPPVSSASLTIAQDVTAEIHNGKIEVKINLADSEAENLLNVKYQRNGNITGRDRVNLGNGFESTAWEGVMSLQKDSNQLVITTEEGLNEVQVRLGDRLVTINPERIRGRIGEINQAKEHVAAPAAPVTSTPAVAVPETPTDILSFTSHVPRNSQSPRAADASPVQLQAAPESSSTATTAAVISPIQTTAAVSSGVVPAIDPARLKLAEAAIKHESIGATDNKTLMDILQGFTAAELKAIRDQWDKPTSNSAKLGKFQELLQSELDIVDFQAVKAALTYETPTWLGNESDKHCKRLQNGFEAIKREVNKWGTTNNTTLRNLLEIYKNELPGIESRWNEEESYEDAFYNMLKLELSAEDQAKYSKKRDLPKK
jgi:hypothetical protein